MVDERIEGANEYLAVELPSDGAATSPLGEPLWSSPSSEGGLAAAIARGISNLARWLTVARYPVLVVSCFWLFATGVWGLGRGSTGLVAGGADFEYLYRAGRFWLAGKSPYDVSAFVAGSDVAGTDLVVSAFAYPPIVAPFCAFLGLLPHDVAELTLVALNLGLAVAIARASVLLTTFGQADSDSRWLWFGVLTVTLISPFISHVVWMGQTSIVATGLIVLAALLQQRGQLVLAGVLAALSMLKPQLALLPVAWLFLCSGARFRVASIGTLLVLSLWSVGVSGPFGLVEEYLASVHHYRSVGFQQLGFQHLFGLRSLAFSMGLELPTLAPLALIGFAAMLHQRKRFLALGDVIALLLVGSLLFVFGHDYDLVACIPAVAVLFRQLRHEPRWLLVALFGLLALYVPQRFLRGLEVPWLGHYRELVVMAFGVVLTWRTLRPRSAEWVPVIRSRRA